jgi:hypothetical protein
MDLSRLHTPGSYSDTSNSLDHTAYNSRIKVKLSWGSGCIDPRFLDLGPSWRSVVSFMPFRFTSEERASGTHWIGGWLSPRACVDDVGKRKFLTLPGLELQPVASSYTDCTIMVPGMAGWLVKMNSKVAVAWFKKLSPHLPEEESFSSFHCCCCCCSSSSSYYYYYY